jgi:hypothetical protein
MSQEGGPLVQFNSQSAGSEGLRGPQSDSFSTLKNVQYMQAKPQNNRQQGSSAGGCLVRVCAYGVDLDAILLFEPLAPALLVAGRVDTY